MFFLNLSAGEFLTLLGSLGGIVTALYLLDRTRRKRVVSTLRFWKSAVVAEDQPRHRRVSQPWSLLLQLISLLLLLLAIAQLNWGTREFRSRDHVLLLDVSAWSSLKTGNEKVLDGERRAALDYLAALRPSDRVLLVGVDALSTPLTAFTSDRGQLRSALDGVKESYSALNLAGALSYARQAQEWSGGRPGEIVYIGPERIDGANEVPTLPTNLRVIAIPAEIANCGIRSIAVHRNEDDPNSWLATVTLRNDGNAPRAIKLRTQFAGTQFAPRSYVLRPKSEFEAHYDFVTNASGLLVSEIDPHDALPIDDKASLEVPPNGALKVAVYTRRKDLLHLPLAADHRLSVTYFAPDQYSEKVKADAVVIDGFALKTIPPAPSLWINPPRGGGPIPVKMTIAQASIIHWASGIDLGSGLHSREERLPAAEVFSTEGDDVAFASVAAGPTIVLRPRSSTGSKLAVIGFDPLQPQLRFNLTTPLVFANLLSWLSPESFRISDFLARRVGAVTLPLTAAESRGSIRVVNERGMALPFTLTENSLQLFVGEPEVVRVTSGDRERVLSLTLPDVAQQEWKPLKVLTGLPNVASFVPTSTDLWKLLACLGGAGLFAEWYLFGGGRRVIAFRHRAFRSRASKSAVEREKELVTR